MNPKALYQSKSNAFSKALLFVFGVFLFLLAACSPEPKISNGDVVPAELYGSGTRGWMRTSAKQNGDNLVIDPCEIFDTTYFSMDLNGRIAPYELASCDNGTPGEYTIPFKWQLSNNNRTLRMVLEPVFPIFTNPSDTLQVVNVNELTSTKLRISYDVPGQNRYEVSFRPLN
jgi:hypothetical protein